MSPINSALQYKIQKMEKHLSSLMEENEALKAIITEANVAGMSPAAAFNYGGGAALGQNLAMQPNVDFGGAAKVSGAFNPQTMSASSQPAFRSAPAPSLGQGAAPAPQGFDGAYFGQLLASGDKAAIASYLAQFLNTPSASVGVQSARPGANMTSSMRRR
jgi:hypothetical protein